MQNTAEVETKNDKRSHPGLGGLGNATINVSTSDMVEVRRKRYRLQDQAAEILGPDWRVSKCLSHVQNASVQVLKSAEHGHVYYNGLIVCGSVWTCPVCAAKITEGRRKELTAAAGIDNYQKVLVTLTLQHVREDSLKDLVKALNDSLRRLKMGRWWQKFRRDYGVAAYVTGHEFTYGHAAGWHPHKHWLLFVENGQEIDARHLQQLLTEHYQALLARHGRYASEYYGIDVQVGNDHAMNYAAKWGSIEEVTKSPVKTATGEHYSPFQLLDLYAQGQKWAGPVFQEYAKTTKGLKQLTWSWGARTILGIGQEKSDLELAEQEQTEDEIVFTLTFDQWQKVKAAGLRVTLLEIAEEYGADGVQLLLEHIGAA